MHPSYQGQQRACNVGNTWWLWLELQHGRSTISGRHTISMYAESSGNVPSSTCVGFRLNVPGMSKMNAAIIIWNAFLGGPSWDMQVGGLWEGRYASYRDAAIGPPLPWLTSPTLYTCWEISTGSQLGHAIFQYQTLHQVASASVVTPMQWCNTTSPSPPPNIHPKLFTVKFKWCQKLDLKSSDAT